jgi:hypothetical protein
LDRYYYTNSSATPTVTTFLTNCDYFQFDFYQRNPSNNFAFYPTTNIVEIKMIDVDWRCSRQIEGVKINTESIQTARITIRN